MGSGGLWCRREIDQGTSKDINQGRAILTWGKAGDGRVHGDREKPLQAGSRGGGKERQRKANLPGIMKAEAEVLTGPEMRGPLSFEACVQGI